MAHGKTHTLNDNQKFDFLISSNDSFCRVNFNGELFDRHQKDLYSNRSSIASRVVWKYSNKEDSRGYKVIVKGTLRTTLENTYQLKMNSRKQIKEIVIPKVNKKK